MSYRLESDAGILWLSETGMPEKWQVKGNGDIYWGKWRQPDDALGEEPGGMNMVLRRRQDGQERCLPLTECRTAIIPKDGCISIGIAADWEREHAVDAELIWTATPDGFRLEWGEVKEWNGFHLIEITLPDLLSSPAEKELRFFHGENRGGYLSDLDHMDENSMIRGESRFQGYPNASILPVAGLIKKGSVCVLEVLAWMGRTLLTADRKRGAALGVTAPWRIRGGKKTPDIPVNQKEIARFSFGAPREGAEEADWMDAAALVRKHFAGQEDTYFDDRIVFIVQNQLGRKKTELNYRETEALLRRISNLIGGQPQTAFLTGWSQGGHDTSYPNVYTMNPDLGTEEEFQELKRRALEFGCTVSLNDNFDDMYRNEFTEERWFREKYVARTRENELETFETWNGVDQSYITGMYQYMKPGEDGEKRIRCHGEKYGLQDAMLIDAMSWWSIRNDWNPENPASAADNLRAKFRIIQEFWDKYGIRVCSELVRYPFIGKLPLAFDNAACYDRPSDHDIPFLREVLRGVMFYGGRGGDELDIPDLLYHNAAKHSWFRKGESDRRITDIYYLNYVPWFLLHRLAITGYQVRGGVYDIELEQNAKIHLDKQAEGWYVEYGKNRILEDRKLSCPLGKDRIAFYADQDCCLSYGGLKGAVVKEAFSCRRDGKGPAEVWIRDGRLFAQVQEGVPVQVILE